MFDFRQSVCDDTARRSGADYHEIVMLRRHRASFPSSFLEHGHKRFIEQVFIVGQEVFGRRCHGFGIYYVRWRRIGRLAVQGVAEQVHQKPKEHVVFRLTPGQRIFYLHAHPRHVFGRERRGIVVHHFSGFLDF